MRWLSWTPVSDATLAASATVKRSSRTTSAPDGPRPSEALENHQPGRCTTRPIRVPWSPGKQQIRRRPTCARILRQCELLVRYCQHRELNVTPGIGGVTEC